MNDFRLRHLGFGHRVGLTAILACLGVGQLAGLVHMQKHYDKRDDRPGFTTDDIKSAYHGLDAPAPILTKLNSGHPDTLKEADRKVLTAWLTSGKIEQDYDNPDLGALSPKEIVAASCLQCHSTKSAPEKAHALKLDTTADIKKVSFSRQVLPTPPEKVIVSIHAHAPTIALMAFAVMALAAFSRWPRGLTGLLSGLGGLGLCGEFAGMWFARTNESFISVLLVSGGVFHACFALLTLLTFLDLWFPGGRGKGGCGGKCACGKRAAESNQ